MSVSENNPIDFGIDEFVEEMDFDQLISLIRAEPAQISLTSATSASVVDTTFHSQFHEVPSFSPEVPGDLFDFNSCSAVFDDPNSTLNPLSGIEEDQMKEGEDEEEEEDEEINEIEQSSATASTVSKKAKLDRTRTLICERKRRGRMKEKLYALRALVPNITKMDKASIVGDAVLYVQELQMQAKKLKAEISYLESSSKDASRFHGFTQDPEKNPIARILVPAPRIITQMDMFKVEEGEFYVRLQSNKGQGVAVSLYKALESMSNFVVRSSSLTGVFERFILAFTVRECQEDVNIPSLKTWVIRAFVNQGFELKTA